jgi:hypothetical protein
VEHKFDFASESDFESGVVAEVSRSHNRVIYIVMVPVEFGTMNHSAGEDQQHFNSQSLTDHEFRV